MLAIVKEKPALGHRTYSKSGAPRANGASKKRKLSLEFISCKKAKADFSYF